MAKVDGAGMAFQKLLIMNNCTQRRWTTRICFTNNGTKPLIITNTQGSCGCTVPTSQRTKCSRYYWCKIYATDRVGAFTKTVTVTSNADGQATKILTIKVSY
jgi:hypothetical protein